MSLHCVGLLLAFPFRMFFRLLEKMTWYSTYGYYRNKYHLPRSFRFCGYCTAVKGCGSFIVGQNTYIGGYSDIAICEGTTLKIGSNVSIGSHFFCRTVSRDAGDHVMGIDRRVEGDIAIGNNVWIGRGVFVKHGISIGDNVVIGANSVVSKNIPSGEVWAGAPARQLHVKSQGFEPMNSNVDIG